MCEQGVNIGKNIWCKQRCEHGVNIGVNIGVSMQKEHFVCIILCEIFILTLLYHTYIGRQHVSSLVRFLFHQQGLSHGLIFLSYLHPHENVQRQFY